MVAVPSCIGCSLLLVQHLQGKSLPRADMWCLAEDFEVEHTCQSSAQWRTV